MDFLTTRVKAPDADDWKKLVRLVRYLRGTPELSLFLSTDSSMISKWYIEGSHTAHPNMRGQTGGALTLGKGMPITGTTTQKLSTRFIHFKEMFGCWGQRDFLRFVVTSFELRYNFFHVWDHCDLYFTRYQIIQQYAELVVYIAAMKGHRPRTILKKLFVCCLEQRGHTS